MKSSLAPLKYVVDCWTCHNTTSVLDQENNVRLTMELEVHKRPISRPTLSTIMVQWVLQWKRQKRSSHCKCQGTMIEKSCLYIYGQMFPCLRGKKGRRRKRENQILFFFPKTALLKHILKHQHIHFLLHDHLSWSMFASHLVKGSKYF